jgi:transglutaminase-like putative cysteine protease
MPRIDFNTPLLWLIVPLTLVLAPHVLDLPIWISLSWMIFALLSVHSMQRKKAWPGWLKMLLSLAGVAGVLLQYGTVIGPQGGVALLVFLSGAKLLEIQTTRDRLGLLFVGCFLLVAYFLNSQSLLMAGYMVFAAVALVAAMIANVQTSALNDTKTDTKTGTKAIPQSSPHAAPELRATLGMAGRLLAQALPLALLLFLLFPRLQGPLWGLPQQGTAQTGLSDRMSPGDFGQLTLSDEIAFRVEFFSPPPSPSALYWRGPVLWDFDGRTWQTRFAVPTTSVRGEAIGQPITYAITLEPHRQRWLFLLGLPRELPAKMASIETSLGPDLQWLSKTAIAQRLRYQINADLDFRLEADTLSAASRSRTLALPEGNPQARALAAQWVSQYEGNTASEQAIVNQALAHFRNEAFFYSLKPPLLGENSVDDFLFVSRRGFCEHYASAFVVLMRTAGIPARVVTGYQGGELNPLGDYWIVRQRDAHAWAEVWLPNQGWTRVDPTAAVAPNRVERGLNAALPANERPAGLMTLNTNWLMPLRQGWDLLNNQWNQWVLGYNQDRQREFLARLNPFLSTWQGMAWGLAAAGGVLLLIASFWAIPRLARVKRDPASQLYTRFCLKLQRHGIVRGDAEGAADFARRAAQLRPDIAEPIRLITQLYLGLRYGQAEADKLAQLKKWVNAFKP